ncbi:MAG: hypothetical protein ABH873_04540 [Candidatus Firestonebacteria bacterium]
MEKNEVVRLMFIFLFGGALLISGVIGNIFFGKNNDGGIAKYISSPPYTSERLSILFKKIFIVMGYLLLAGGIMIIIMLLTGQEIK